MVEIERRSRAQRGTIGLLLAAAVCFAIDPDARGQFVNGPPLQVVPLSSSVSGVARRLAARGYTHVVLSVVGRTIVGTAVAGEHSVHIVFDSMGRLHIGSSATRSLNTK